MSATYVANTRFGYRIIQMSAIPCVHKINACYDRQSNMQGIDRGTFRNTSLNQNGIRESLHFISDLQFRYSAQECHTRLHCGNISHAAFFHDKF